MREQLSFNMAMGNSSLNIDGLEERVANCHVQVGNIWFIRSFFAEKCPDTSK
jgi:hypothetical protein